jgi:hypothetical protein
VTTNEPLDGTIDLTGGAAPIRPLRINGNGASADAAHLTVPGAAPVGTGLDGVNWFPAYDRASVEGYLDSLDAERARLEAQIADAERRTLAAQEALAERTAEMEAALGAVVLAARSELDRIDREQQETVAAVRAEATAEAARIREAARLEAETVSEAASSLSALAQIEGRADAG